MMRRSGSFLASSIEEGASAMTLFAGLDVSVRETSVCVVDEAGKVLAERKVATEPDDLIELLRSISSEYGRIGLEAGPLSQWLVNGLTAAGLPVVCVESRHMMALLKAQQVNKSDRNDSRGIAQMMRVGLFKAVQVKTQLAQEQRMLLSSRKLVQRKLLDVESDLRGTLRNFGLKVGMVSAGKFEARIRELVTGFPRLALIVEPLLAVRLAMRQQFAVLHKMLLDTVRHDPVCRLLMTAPGVGAVVALTYRATVDQPQRFVHSRAVGAHVGLTPRRHQSGEIDYDGGVSKSGDTMLRPPDLWAMSRTLHRHQFVNQPKISAWKQRFGGVEVIAEMPKRMVGGSVGERVEADGEGFGWQIRQEIDLGVVDSAQQAAGIVTARHLLTDNLHHGSLGPVCDHFDGIHQMLALRA